MEGKAAKEAYARVDMHVGEGVGEARGGNLASYPLPLPFSPLLWGVDSEFKIFG